MVGAWLVELDGLALVAVLRSRAELLAGITALDADVLLRDVVLPEGPVDAALLRTLRGASTRPLRVVLISSFPPDELGAIAEQTGADGWCSKAGGVDGLLSALQSA